MCSVQSSDLYWGNWVTRVSVGWKGQWLIPTGQFLEKDLWQGVGSLMQWVRRANITYKFYVILWPAVYQLIFEKIRIINRMEHGKFWVFFFLMSHHLQHRQISHHPWQAVSFPPEASDIRKGEDYQTAHLQEKDKQKFLNTPKPETKLELTCFLLLEDRNILLHFSLDCWQSLPDHSRAKMF